MTASRSRWRVQKKRLLLLDNDCTRRMARLAEDELPRRIRVGGHGNKTRKFLEMKAQYFRGYPKIKTSMVRKQSLSGFVHWKMHCQNKGTRCACCP